MPRLLRAAGVLTLLALPFLGGTAHADTPSPSPSGSTATTAPAGTTFRTAGSLVPGQNAQATGAVGDYFYWSFQAQAGQAPTVTATVQLPTRAAGQGAESWRLDLYDGLRRAQPCVAGSPQAQATADAASVQLSCTLPTIRSWAETWSDDPLPGTYYIRLTVGTLAEQDLGLPVSAQLTLATASVSSVPADGSLSTPLTLPAGGPSSTGAGASGTTASASPAPTTADAATGSSPGFFSRLFSGGNARWWWTGAGAVTASLTGVLGFTLTRHPRRWFS